MSKALQKIADGMDDALQVAKADGRKYGYYQPQEGTAELNELIRCKDMSYARENAFKTLFHMDGRDGESVRQAANKVRFYADEMERQFKRGFVA